MCAHAQEYKSFESWCNYMYPTVAGPNNPDPEKGLIRGAGMDTGMIDA